MGDWEIDVRLSARAESFVSSTTPVPAEGDLVTSSYSMGTARRFFRDNRGHGVKLTVHTLRKFKKCSELTFLSRASSWRHAYLAQEQFRLFFDLLCPANWQEETVKYLIKKLQTLILISTKYLRSNA